MMINISCVHYIIDVSFNVTGIGPRILDNTAVCTLMKPSVATVKQNNKQKNGDQETSKSGEKKLERCMRPKNQLMELRFSQKFSVQKEIIYFFPKVQFQHTDVRKTVFYWQLTQKKVIHTGEEAIIKTNKSFADKRVNKTA